MRKYGFILRSSIMNGADKKNLPQAIYRGDHGPSNQLKNATEMKPVGEQGQRLVCAFTAAFEQRKLNGVAPFTDEEIRMFVEGWSWADNDAIYQHRKHQSVKPEAR